MLISSHDKQDFEMSYFNRDGSPGSLCGNGARCIALFAKKHGITNGDNMEFLSFDGSHKAYIRNDLITIQMKDVTGITNTGEYFFLDTGSPHAVLFKNDVRSLNVCEEAQKIRYDRQYDPGGTNVNYVQIEEHSIFVRTYERGVEDETLSCGTGVVASAICAVREGYIEKSPVSVITRGGSLEIDFKMASKTEITDIKLTGTADFVFEGKIEI